MADTWYGTGRRKNATARVYLRPGTGKVVINRRDVTDYFPREAWRNLMLEPIHLTELDGRFDLLVTVAGGGMSGQAGAVSHGLARALEQYDSELRGTLKRAGLLRRDAREKERKKYGQRGARARFQFSKR